MRLERICPVISLCYFTVFKTTTTLNGEGNGNPSPGEYCTHQILLPGELHGQRSLAGYSPWGHKESDLTEQLSLIHTRANAATWTCKQVLATLTYRKGLAKLFELPCSSNSKEPACDAGDLGLTTGSQRSGEGYHKPFQYSCLENPVDRGAWWATVHVVSKSWT